ncbi:hypothetical protein [Moheibacter lacus]|uniref:Uncharacterized protein n=1 Tax=Moheibacter lacus TaxID=2745851 RepID=A0A838ZJC9_9FLAO|nr:hypothetical protein [Moheibacter lacus]MBA5629358.1 hypothetical protein [Moheibacter lacus]
MNLTAQKKKLIQWIDSVNDPKILEEIERFSKEEPFDFENEIQNAITANELKKRTTEFLKKLDWTK